MDTRVTCHIAFHPIWYHICLIFHSQHGIHNIDHNIDGLVQDCSNSSATALELLQSYTKPSILYWWFRTNQSEWDSQNVLSSRVTSSRIINTRNIIWRVSRLWCRFCRLCLVVRSWCFVVKSLSNMTSDRIILSWKCAVFYWSLQKIAKI